MDRELIENKAKNLVAISIEEGKTKEETEAADNSLVRSLLAEIDVPEVSAAVSANQVSWFRHGPDGVSLSSPGSPSRLSRRPIKIKLPSAELRSAALAAIRKKRPECLKSQDGAYVRRELTAPELALEDKQKKRVDY